MTPETRRELERLHEELSATLDWDVDWEDEQRAITYGVIVRRMAAIEEVLSGE